MERIIDQILHYDSDIALLSDADAAQEADESGNYSEAIIGTSVAVLGTAAAIFAARRCTKDDNHFERQWARISEQKNQNGGKWAI